jgi:uncharacterized phage-associated protein
MTKAWDVALHFLAKDPDKETFNLELIERDGRSFYEGNAKLNKFLHMAQNMYIAMTGEPLFGDAMFAFDNGAVVDGIWDNYVRLRAMRCPAPGFADDLREFLDRVYRMFKPADVDELIALSHEDDEWAEKNARRRKRDQLMDSMSRADEYKGQYANALTALYRMDMRDD